MNTSTDETQKQESEMTNGLSIKFNEESSTLEFSWNPNTDPEWNYLSELPEEEVKDRFIRFLEAVETDPNESEDDLFAYFLNPSTVEQTDDSN